MSSHQLFTWNNISIKFFPDEEALFIEPGRNASKDKLKLLKNKIETILTTDSIKTEPNGLSVKLAQGAASNAKEFLRSIGADGGEAIEDAASVAQQPAEEEIEEKEDEQQLPPSMQTPGAGGMDMPQPQQMMAAHLYPKFFSMLYEGMFGDSDTFLKAKKPGRRTGKYWRPLESATGKNRAKINKQDVLSKRKEYSRKPPSSSRDKVLRSLDKAFNYFFNKLEEVVGSSAAEKYAEEYYAIDDLNPKDYALEKKIDPIGPEEEAEIEYADDGMNAPSFAEFADVLADDGESYDDIEIEEDTY